jgi:hypothetical protein
MRENKLKQFLYKYRYILIQTYWLIYLPWFMYLEKTVTTHFHVIHMELDDVIPFLPVFCIPYFMWFGYVALALINSYRHDKPEYVRACVYLFTGMTIFLIISTVYPNGHYMRYQVNLGCALAVVYGHCHEPFPQHPCIQLHRCAYRADPKRESAG